METRAGALRGRYPGRQVDMGTGGEAPGHRVMRHLGWVSKETWRQGAFRKRKFGLP